MSDKKKLFQNMWYIFLLFVFGISNAAVIWITISSREPAVREVYMVPFESYSKILEGNKQYLIENIENILLFVPFGCFLSWLFHARKRVTLVLGCLFSIWIESTQLVFELGSFEIDDLFHNTLGTFVGIGIANLIPFYVKEKDRRITLLSAILCTGMALWMAQGLYIISENQRVQRMTGWAALNNKNGQKNLLILDGKNGYASGSEVFIKYHPDGYLSITGDAEERAWYRLGEISLHPGTYLFTGMSGVDEKTVALELEMYDREKEKFIRLTPDIGPLEEVLFTLQETTDIRAYVGVYPGNDYNEIARPAIYYQGE